MQRCSDYMLGSNPQSSEPRINPFELAIEGRRSTLEKIPANRQTSNFGQALPCSSNQNEYMKFGKNVA